MAAIESPSLPRNNRIVKLTVSLSGYRSNRYPLVKGGSASERSSRTSSLISVASNLSSSTDWSPEVDYKTLYENEKVENEKLVERVKRLEDLVNEAISNNQQEQQNGCIIVNDEDTIENVPTVESERQNLERRISELEKITKTMEQLRLDNQRLKEENGALIRVISKLSR